MSTSDSTPGVSAASGRPVGARFATTRWSLVAAAGSRQTPDARESLARLCQVYWYPLTQAFFARLLEKNWIAGADRTKGRFRTFLLSAMTHFLADEWDRARAQKRGGGVQLVPLPLEDAEPLRFGGRDAGHARTHLRTTLGSRSAGLYWAFVSLGRLADGFDALRSDRPDLALRSARGLATAKATSFVAVWTIGWVPGLAWLVTVADALLFVLDYRDIAFNANWVIGPGAGTQAAAA